jgi:hypothetical protein
MKLFDGKMSLGIVAKIHQAGFNRKLIINEKEL